MLWLSIMIVVLSVAVILAPVVLQEFKKPYLMAAGLLTLTFGIADMILKHYAELKLREGIARYGTPFKWENVKANLNVVSTPNAENKSYQLVLKVVPPNHRVFRTLGTVKKKTGHALAEVAEIPEETAEEIFHAMSHENRSTPLRREYESGIFQYHFSGNYISDTEAIQFEPTNNPPWPSLYASLSELQGKYIVGYFFASGAQKIIASNLSVSFDSSLGERSLVFTFPNKQREELDFKLENITSFYFGGYIEENKFTQ